MNQKEQKREKDIFISIPPQLSPNPLRRTLLEESPLSSDESTASFSKLSTTSTNKTNSTTTTSILTATTTNSSTATSTKTSSHEPTTNFNSLLQRRNGSVLNRDIILKSEHFFKGMNSIESELKLMGAPNFRSTNLNIFGAAQPNTSGLTTILRVLGCGPGSSQQHSHSSVEKAPEQSKRAIWFSTREEPIIYINETSFVVRDLVNPLVNIKSYSGISGLRLEAVERRLKADIENEAKRNNGLILVHDEQDDGNIIPCLVSVDSVKTPKEVLEGIKEAGFAVDYYRIPVSHEQSPTDPYIDEYFKVFSTTPTEWPVIFSCGMGIGRTTYGMVIGLLIRRAQIIHATGEDPFHINTTQSTLLESKSRTMLRLVYILEQGLKSKQSSQSAIEWILARPGTIDKLESAINGNYQVINDLVRVLYNGSFCKQIVDSAIDRCDTVVNLREHILLYRVRSLTQSGPNSSLDTGLGFLERYFSLISFCEYVEKQLFHGGDWVQRTFQQWMQNHKEIWKMLTYLRSSNNKLKAFRPIDELTDQFTLNLQSQILSAFKSPQMKSVSEDVAVVQSRSGTVLGPNTILKIDHWTNSSPPTQTQANQGRPDPLIVPGAPNFRKIQLPGFDNHHIYAVAQPTLSALHAILEKFSTSQPRRIVWINVREEPILYINNEPYVLRDQYASLRNIKAYTGITARRLEQMELKLRDDVISESRTHLGRILLHSEGPDHDIEPIWESVTQVTTMQELFAENSQFIKEYPQLEYYRVPITAEEAPEPEDFDTLHRIISKTPIDPSNSNSNKNNLQIFIFNCQMGVGRSTTGSVIGGLILNKALFTLHNNADKVQIFHKKGVHLHKSHSKNKTKIQYKVITNLIRMLKFGNEAKEAVDSVIDGSDQMVNLRLVIEDYRKAAHRCTDDRQNCRKLVNKGIQCLKRYALLIMYESFLLETYGNQDNNGSSGMSFDFADWVQKHPEFGNLFHEIESKGSESMTILSTGPISTIESLNQDPESEDKSSPIQSIIKVPAADMEVKDMVANRIGSVLAPMTILKFDHFIGCQKQSLPERIEGAPNFRQVPLPNPGLYVYGLAMPTKAAIERVLERIDCRPGNSERRCLWISMREEPVIFVNGQPYVLRIVKDPVSNLEMTGIVSERVELMESRLKIEAEAEAIVHSNKILLHEEEASLTAPQGFEVVPEWESVLDPHTSLESPAEVYQHVIQAHGYPLKYVRVPVTDEQAPIPVVFDELIRIISKEDYTDFIFNCQMGRGRTTTGMVITMLYHRIKYSQVLQRSANQHSRSISPVFVISDPDPDPTVSFLKGEYKLIHKLCQLLEFGRVAKEITDECIDACAHLQNLREAIYDYKTRLTSATVTASSSSSLLVREIETRGFNYLLRYFYLILFAEYLIEESKICSSPGPCHHFSQSFLQWISDRREITNLTLPERGELNFN